MSKKQLFLNLTLGLLALSEVSADDRSPTDPSYLGMHGGEGDPGSTSASSHPVISTSNESPSETPSFEQVHGLSEPLYNFLRGVVSDGTHLGTDPDKFFSKLKEGAKDALKAAEDDIFRAKQLQGYRNSKSLDSEDLDSASLDSASLDSEDLNSKSLDPEVLEHLINDGCNNLEGFISRFQSFFPLGFRIPDDKIYHRGTNRSSRQTTFKEYLRQRSQGQCNTVDDANNITNLIISDVLTHTRAFLEAQADTITSPLAKALFLLRYTRVLGMPKTPDIGDLYRNKGNSADCEQFIDIFTQARDALNSVALNTKIDSFLNAIDQRSFFDNNVPLSPPHLQGLISYRISVLHKHLYLTKDKTPVHWESALDSLRYAWRKVEDVSEEFLSTADPDNLIIGGADYQKLSLKFLKFKMYHYLLSCAGDASPFLQKFQAFQRETKSTLENARGDMQDIVQEYSADLENPAYTFSELDEKAKQEAFLNLSLEEKVKRISRSKMLALYARMLYRYSAYTEDNVATISQAVENAKKSKYIIASDPNQLHIFTPDSEGRIYLDKSLELRLKKALKEREKSLRQARFEAAKEALNKWLVEALQEAEEQAAVSSNSETSSANPSN